jgi:hypothetical protein
VAEDVLVGVVVGGVHGRTVGSRGVGGNHPDGGDWIPLLGVWPAASGWGPNTPGSLHAAASRGSDDIDHKPTASYRTPGAQARAGRWHSEGFDKLSPNGKFSSASGHARLDGAVLVCSAAGDKRLAAANPMCEANGRSCR